MRYIIFNVSPDIIIIITIIIGIIIIICTLFPFLNHLDLPTGCTEREKQQGGNNAVSEIGL